MNELSERKELSHKKKYCGILGEKKNIYIKRKEVR